MLAQRTTILPKIRLTEAVLLAYCHLCHNPMTLACLKCAYHRRQVELVTKSQLLTLLNFA